MSQIKLFNNASAGVVNLENIVPLKYIARFHVTYWNAEIADVEVDNSPTIVDVPTSQSATVTAVGMSASAPSAQRSITVEAQTLIAADGENGTITLSIGTAAATEMLTLINNCSSLPVTFQLAPSGGPTQSWTVAPNEQFPVSLAAMFTAYARVHDYPDQPSGSNGYDTPKVGFSNANAQLTVLPNSSKGNSFHIEVG